MVNSDNADILLTRLNPTPIRTFRFHTRDSLNGRLLTPVEIFELPEEDATKAILTKVLGNRLEIVLRTKLSNGAHEVDGVAGSDTWNGQQYLDELLTQFENKTIEHEFRISLVKKGTADPLTQPFSYDGSIAEIAFDQGEGSPTGGYNLSVNFLVGDVITVITEEVE